MRAIESPAQPKSATPVYILDTSAILRYLDREAGWPRVHSALAQCSVGDSRVLVSAVNWGELASRLYRQHGPDFQAGTMAALLTLGIEVIPATAERAVKSGQIKGRLSIPYADAFGVELASDSPGHLLVTADFDVKPAASEVQIEFLPTK